MTDRPTLDPLAPSTSHPELQPLLTELRQFLDREVAPLETRLTGRFRDLLPDLERLRGEVKRRGWWAPQVPKAWGGGGLSLREFAFVSEVLGRSPLGHFLCNCQAPDAGNMELLLEFATPAQQERWLRPLAAGTIRSCFSMTEPDFPGSNPVWMGTTARLDGDHYEISGRKWFTSSADGAAFAVVMAVTDPEAPPHQRASLLIVPAETPGFRLVRNISCMGHAGDDWNSHSEVVYERCRVPRDHLLGQLGAGFAMAQARLGPGRIHHCMRFLGIAERSFEMLCHRAATRELAPGRKLGQQQAVQHWIADSRAELLAARLMVLHTAERMDAVGTKAAREEISLIKFYVAQVMMNVVDRALQAHGALGFSDDVILAEFYRQGRAARIYDGADEVHKSAVAKQVLRRYGLEIGA
ncbi:MAG TPA: acyl-CoA dehydrogenase family protein [Gemmatales bacterium]|nr:acyl-CoA dehydrogenase family protein [Gemmatales bacterium]HMP59967.1 acyl-CoA dehydrogenase family protein [Gemmatales bacterium]